MIFHNLISTREMLNCKKQLKGSRGKDGIPLVAGGTLLGICVE